MAALDGVQLSTIDKILKLDYQGPIREQVTNKNVLLAHIKKATTRNSFQGLKSVIPVHTGRNVGRAFRQEGDILPPAGSQSHDQVAFHMSYLYGRIQITGQTIAASRNDKGSFARALDLEMKGLQKDINHTLSRVVWGDGTGLLSLCCPTVSGDANKDGQALVRVVSARWLEVGMEVFVAQSTGEVLSGAYSAAGVHTPATITAIDYDNPGVKTGPADVTLSANLGKDFSAVSELNEGGIGLYQFGSRVIAGPTATDGTANSLVAQARWGKPTEMWGIKALVSAGNPGWEVGRDNETIDGAVTGGGAGADTYSFNRGGLGTGAAFSANTATGFMGDLDRSVAGNEYWQSNRVRSMKAIDENFDELQEAYDLTDIEGEVEPGLLLTSHRIRRALARVMIQNRRFGTEKTLKSGWTGVEFNNSVIVVDKHASEPTDGRDLTWDENGTNNTDWFPGGGTDLGNNHFSTIYLLKPSTMKFTVMEDLAWEDTGGVIVRSGVGAAAIDQYEAFMKAYWNLAIDMPRQNSYIDHVTQTRTTDVTP